MNFAHDTMETNKHPGKRGSLAIRIGWICVLVAALANGAALVVVLENETTLGLVFLYCTRILWIALALCSLAAMYCRRWAMGAILLIGGSVIIFSVGMLAGMSAITGKLVQAFHDPVRSTPVKVSESDLEIMRQPGKHACEGQDPSCAILCSNLKAVDRAKSPPPMVFVVDTTVSMVREAHLQKVRFAISLLAEVFPQQSYAIVSRGAQEDSRPLVGHEAVIKRLQQFTVDSLFEPTSMILEGLTSEKALSEKKEIVLFTDTHVSLTLAPERLRSGQNRLSFYYFSSAEHSELEQLALSSGGRFVRPTSTCDTARLLLEDISSK